jgi:hypothetical protein
MHTLAFLVCAGNILSSVCVPICLLTHRHVHSAFLGAVLC